MEYGKHYILNHSLLISKVEEQTSYKFRDAIIMISIPKQYFIYPFSRMVQHPNKGLLS